MSIEARMATNALMAIAFVGSVVPEEMCARLRACSVAGNQFQLELTKALEQTTGFSPKIISLLPIPSYPKERRLIVHAARLRASDKLDIQLFPFVNFPILKQVTMSLSVLVYLSRWLRQAASQPRYVLVYNVYAPLALAVLGACRVFGGKTVAIVADLPHDMNYDFAGPWGFIRRLNFAVERWSLKRFSGLVPVSPAIVQDFAPGRPALVMDGGVEADNLTPDLSSRPSPKYASVRVLRDDGSPSPSPTRRGENGNLTPSTRPKDALSKDIRGHARHPAPMGRGEEPTQNVWGNERICMYSGALTRVNGIELLLQGFSRIFDPTYQLWISGRGELEALVTRAAEQDPRITYLGYLPNARVVTFQQRATVLVNPRLTNLLIQRYTFPSKLREYMLSGRPVITTAVASIPADYIDFVYVLRDETPEGLADLIQQVCSKDAAELSDLGKRARKFVIETRNWNRQAQRIVEFLSTL